MPLLKRLTFRLFGYRGALDFTVQPDSWIRDLPLLDVGPGVYVSNKATIGTNMCLQNGDILVAPVRIGPGALIGHLCMVAPGASIAEGAEIGVGVAIGLNVRVGRGAKISSCAIVNHGAVIGDRCEVGAGAYVGAKAVVESGVSIPPGCVVPKGAVLRSNDDVVGLKAISRSSAALLAATMQVAAT